MIARYCVRLLAGLVLSSAAPATENQATPAPSDAVAIEIPRDPALAARLQKALIAKGIMYRPRTEHLDTQRRPVYTNRLILEDSPYLLQHAHNPVDWFAWGPEAFATAKKENKPIFLSIGYSTCHWCHVMEKESFENPQIAQLINRNFIPIKVDRENRPDVDATYMTAVMLIAGQGGWPMSSFLTPDGKTFFGGTYYPPAQFTQLLQRIDRLWQEKRPELLAQADRIAEAVANVSATHKQAEKLGDDVIQEAVSQIMSRYDELQGGFSQAPKFPNEPLLYLLLNHAERTSDKHVVDALENTLVAMAHGGIYDQIGGGFHRYATDNEWLVPHFEKMLYNQAHLARVYLLGWRLTGNPAFEHVVRQTLDYVLREMTDAEGGFYSATDADSEGEEGLFFLWTPEQIKAVLEPDDAELAINLYNVSPSGSFEGRNILHRSQSLEEFAASHQRDHGRLIDQFTRINLRLLERRKQRIPPLRDDKVITAWNGMMITAFAQAGDLLHEPRYLAAATRAAEYISRYNLAGKGRLWRASLHGKTSVAASQEDYAYLAEGLLMLFDVTSDQRWLQQAREITDGMLAQFWDHDNDGFFMSTKEAILTAMGRPKDSSDNAIPSGNSVAFHVLQKLSRRTDNLDYEKHARATLAAFAAPVTRHPSGFAYLLSGANDQLNGELGARQFAARGAVAVHAVMNSGQHLTLDLSIRPGWHINADQPLQNYLIPTSLRLPANTTAWQLDRVQYPPAIIRKLGFQRDELALYDSQVKITAAVSRTDQPFASGQPIPVELRLQACSDEVCLPPETLRLQVREAPRGGGPAAP